MFKFFKLSAIVASLVISTGCTRIEYMQTQSQLLIAQGIREGKVHTTVVPVDFKGMVNLSK